MYYFYMVSYENIPVTSETTVIKETVLKHLLAFRHVGNVTLSRPAEPIASTKVNLDPFPLAHLARKCNSMLLPQCDCGLLGKGGAALSSLLQWLSGFSSPSRTRLSSAVHLD